MESATDLDSAPHTCHEKRDLSYEGRRTYVIVSKMQHNRMCDSRTMVPCALFDVYNLDDSVIPYVAGFMSETQSFVYLSSIVRQFEGNARKWVS